MLWLPVFSGSALAMVSCPHMSSQAQSEAMSLSATDDDAHCNMQHQQKTDNSASGCDLCGQCHVTCSPGITASLRTPLTTASNVEHASPLQLFHSVTLPLLDPPPLALPARGMPVGTPLLHSDPSAVI